jgi:citrate synthase
VLKSAIKNAKTLNYWQLISYPTLTSMAYPRRRGQIGKYPRPDKSLSIRFLRMVGFAEGSEAR